MLRNDFAACMLSGKKNQPASLSSAAAFKLGTTDTEVAFNQNLDSSNSTWLINDLTYPSQVSAPISLTLSLKSAASWPSSVSQPKPLEIPAQKATMICTKKSAGMTYKATVKKVNPSCPSGYKFSAYVPAGN